MKKILWLGIALLFFLPFMLGIRQSETFPRIWTEKALKDWELPLADSAYSQQPVSEEYYYNLPERVVYKNYPVYHPDYEPEGYQDWLMQQEQ